MLPWPLKWDSGHKRLFTLILLLAYIREKINEIFLKHHNLLRNASLSARVSNPSGMKTALKQCQQFKKERPKLTGLLSVMTILESGLKKPAGFKILGLSVICKEK